ncbi:MAG: ADP-forming succinate--CoA ligase subunit beta [bacterium]|nr:ADP-forming succinate--CoA ligase subunit beta [bacterium]
MKIHEYQGKEILQRFGVPVPKGVAVLEGEDARQAAGHAWELLEQPVVVVKAQIHAGGRGKGGGVKLARSREECQEHAARIMGMQLVTHQTGPQGQRVRRLWIEQGCAIDHEYYAGLVLDRQTSRVTLMVSTEGGMEIEKVAAETPERIIKEAVDPRVGFQPYQARRLAFGLGLAGDQHKAAVRTFLALARAYEETDASLFEINPLVSTKDGGMLALDAKVNFDDNSLFRHRDFLELRDLAEEDPNEIEASKHELNYIKLDGTVGCMVNGAGLAMATMDIIKHVGGEPANFLDVGGGANATTVEAGFNIILSDANVRAVLINIFGGIVRCDRVAGGVIEAVRKVGLKVPVVVRLAGTNHEEAAAMLRGSGIDLIVANDLKDAAEKVVHAARGN